MTDKKPRVYPKIDEKHAAFAVLVKGGVDKVKAAEVLGYKPNKAYDLARRVEKKGHKLDVASESMVRLAHRAVKNCLKGQPWGKIEVIKDSTALAAAQVVVDRHQPKNQEISPPPRTALPSSISMNVNPAIPATKGILFRRITILSLILLAEIPRSPRAMGPRRSTNHRRVLREGELAHPHQGAVYGVRTGDQERGWSMPHHRTGEPN